MRARLALLAIAALLAGCGSEGTAAGPRFTFARLGGVLRGLTPEESRSLSVSCGGEERKLGIRRMERSLLLAFSWKPGERCTARWGDGPRQQEEAVAPLQADPVPVLVLELEGLLPRRIDRGAANEASFLVFSPSGRRLAIGTQRGFVRVVEVHTGRAVFQTRVAEGWAKAAAFSPDDGTLFIGEQTEEGVIRALALPSGRELWRYHLADDLERTAPSDPGNELTWVEYPGPYRMAATPDGDLLVAGLHNWYPDRKPPVRQLSHLYRFDGKSGAPRWRWPRERPAPLALTWFAFDEAMRLAVGVLGSARDWRPGEAIPPGLYAVDLATGQELWRYPFQPLAPFRSVNTWRSVAVHPEGRLVNASTGDGRLYILERGRPSWIEPRGGPVALSGFPVVAETGSVGATREFAIFALGEGYIPLQAAPKGASTGQPHPNSNAIFFFDWSGHLRYRWPTPNRPNGIALSQDGRWLAVALSKGRLFRREDANGLVLFDTSAPGGRPYAGEYRTEGPIPYDQVALSPDGALIALIESPAAIPDGHPPLGKNRLHILY